ncbi:hypothetical protein CATRI_07405 [Corynebacterium atrinae]|uniref:hypothetical protein n=1 Tax=Corynebacterium atrinae TaxID=1336740 RepID=UPI0025B4670B|nr:hypothetical protein [Corynebacterium atrinae]WJY63562.1 hypothetical protein CATRI_07405 [Corynebacterium atrinae]
MAQTDEIDGHILAPVSNWLSESLWPWVSDQSAAVGDQIVSLTLSALAGGLISWSITRRSDKKARRKQAERDEKLQQEQERRDRRRNLFEYRHWRATESAAEEKQWNVYVDTTPWYRYNWVLSATPKFQERVTSARFLIESMNPEKKSVELTGQFSSRSQKIPPLGVNWVIGVNWAIDEHGLGHWESDGGDSCFFTFDIEKVIDDADGLVITYETEGGEKGYEHHYFSPFDSMKDYRPWEVIELKGDD